MAGGLTISLTYGADGSFTYTVSGGENVPFGTFELLDLRSSDGVNYYLIYRYTLTDNQDHSDTSSHNEGLDAPVQIPLTVTDASGDSASHTINLDILDDGPIAANDNLTLGAIETVVSGSVLSGTYSIDSGAPAQSGAVDQYGADGANGASGFAFGNQVSHIHQGVTTVLILAADGKLTDSSGLSYGTLILNPDGTYTYTAPDPSQSRISTMGGQLRVQYTITDGDGDTALAALNITVEQRRVGPVITPETPEIPTDPENPDFPGVPGSSTSGLLVDESGLANGTESGGDSDVAVNAVKITSHAQLDTLEIGGLLVTFTYAPDGTFTYGVTGAETVPYGNFELLDIRSADGLVYYVSYRYTLTQNQDHPDTADHNESLAQPLDIEIKVTDTNGRTDQHTAHLDILDDGPELELVANGTEEIPGNTESVIASLDFDFGADQSGGQALEVRLGNGSYVQAALQGDGSYLAVVDGATVKIYADGRVAITPGPRQEGELTINFRVTDSDGDTAQASTTVTCFMPFTYQARAVLHAQGAIGISNLTPYLVRAEAINWSGGILPALLYIAGDGQNMLNAAAAADGSLTFTLTDSALAYFAANPAEEYIEVYYKVTVGAYVYTMQVVVPRSGEFISDSYQEKWSDRATEGLIHGEWHGGRLDEDNGQVYNVDSTDMADVMTYDGLVRDSIIHTGDDGADTITVNGLVTASTGKVTDILAKGAASVITVNGTADADAAVRSSGDLSIKATGTGASIGISGARGGVLTSANGKAAVEAEQVTIAGSVHGTYAASGFIDVEGDTVSVSGTGNGDVYGVRSEAAGGQPARTGVTGTDSLTVSALSGSGGDAFGVYSEGNGSQRASGTLSGDKDVQISANSRSANATGMGAVSATNRVSGSTVGLEVEASVGNAVGLLASVNPAAATGTDTLGGSNTIEAGTIAVTATSGSGSVTVARAAADGQSSLSGTNTMTATGGITLQGSASGGVNGLLAQSGGANAAGSGATFNLEVDGLTRASDVSGIVADGVRNVSGEASQNRVQAAAIDVKAVNGKNVYGVRALDGGKNTLSANGDVRLTVDAESSAYGLSAYRASSVSAVPQNTVTAGEGVILSVSSKTLNADGITTASESWSNRGGHNKLTAKYIDVDIDAKGIALGINATAGGHNELTLTGADQNGYALDIRGHGEIMYAKTGSSFGPAASSAGIQASGLIPNEGRNTITNTGSGDIRITTGYIVNNLGVLEDGPGGDIAHGIWTSSQGVNSIDGGGNDITIDVHATRFATGVTCFEGGYTEIRNAGTLDISVNTDFDYGNVWYRAVTGTLGVYTVQGTIDIEDVDTVNITTTSEKLATSDYSQYTAAVALAQDGKAININTQTATANRISLKADSDSEITTGTWLEAGLEIYPGFIRVGGDATENVRFEVTGRSDLIDNSMDYEGQPKLPHKNVAAGMYGDFRSQSGGPNLSCDTLIKGQSVDFIIRGEKETHAAAMWADFTSKHRVEADTVSMNVTTSGTGDAHGMMAECWDVRWGVPGHNTVTAGTVRIHAESEYQGAFGMMATNPDFGGGVYSAAGSSNTITSEGALDLEITARADNGYAWAMYAESRRGDATWYNRNIITGNSSSVDGTSDKIVLNGGVYATGVSKNTITTGSGNDSITINGDFSGNGNTISTQGGNDTVKISGTVGGGTIDTGDGNDMIIFNGQVLGVTLRAGDGTDSLVLMGADATEIGSRYQSWLTTLFGSNFGATGIENIIVNGANNLGEVAWLQTLVDTYNSSVPPANQVTLGISPGPFSALMPLSEELLELPMAVRQTNAPHTAHSEASPFSFLSMGELLDESDADLFGSHTQNQDLLDDAQLFASLCETSVSDGGALVHDCSQAFDALANLDYYHADEIGNSEKSYLESIQKDLFVA